MHFAKIPDEPVENTHAYHLTSSAKALSRESDSAASSEDCSSSEDSEDERVRHLTKLQEQVVFLWRKGCGPWTASPGRMLVDLTLLYLNHSLSITLVTFWHICHV